LQAQLPALSLFLVLLNLKSEEPANHTLLPHSSLLIYEDPSDDPVAEKGGSEGIAIYQKLIDDENHNSCDNKPCHDQSELYWHLKD
jgi:hypothetical protein